MIAQSVPRWRCWGQSVRPHIDVNPISTSPLSFSHLFTQTRKVGCENRRGEFHGTFVHIQVPRGYKSQAVRVMRDRLSGCSGTAVIVCFRSGRLKDALNRFIQQGIILAIGLLDRQPFY